MNIFMMIPQFPNAKLAPQIFLKCCIRFLLRLTCAVFHKPKYVLPQIHTRFSLAAHVNVDTQPLAQSNEKDRLIEHSNGFKHCSTKVLNMLLLLIRDGNIKSKGAFQLFQFKTMKCVHWLQHTFLMQCFKMCYVMEQ
jgi:hypothetical protein